MTTIEIADCQGLLLALAQIAPAIEPPSLVRWGDRFFARDGNSMRYLETSVYIIPPEAQPTDTIAMLGALR